MSYLRHSNHLTLQGSVPQTETDCTLQVSTDADFAACPHTAQSTSGIIVMIRTGVCMCPVHWLSKKQTSTARSTTEAELIALATAMFAAIGCLQAILESILGIDVPVLYQQDNSTLHSVLKTGDSATSIESTSPQSVNALSNLVFTARPMNNALTVSRKSCHHRNGQQH